MMSRAEVQAGRESVETSSHTAGVSHSHTETTRRTSASSEHTHTHTHTQRREKMQLEKQRQQLALILSREVKGGLNLGKKISVPRDIMMEELNLTSNRGSRMFQERQRRVERFTLEGTADSPLHIHNDMEQNQMMTDMQGGNENPRYGVAGKHSLANTLKSTVAKKGNPGVHTSYSYTGPLREIPREKFNSTVIPKSYCSPWREALGESEELLDVQFPQTPEKLPAANYRCFNRAAVPFGGPTRSQRVIPIIAFEQPEIHNLPDVTLATMSKRPNFNRAPRGWGVRYSPESNDL